MSKWTYENIDKVINAAHAEFDNGYFWDRRSILFKAIAETLGYSTQSESAVDTIIYKVANGFDEGGTTTFYRDYKPAPEFAGTRTGKPVTDFDKYIIQKAFKTEAAARRANPTDLEHVAGILRRTVAEVDSLFYETYRQNRGTVEGMGLLKPPQQ